MAVCEYAEYFSLTKKKVMIRSHQGIDRGPLSSRVFLEKDLQQEHYWKALTYSASVVRQGVTSRAAAGKSIDKIAL